MTPGDLLLVGGTSDARALCQILDGEGVPYTLSVASEVGEQLAGPIKGQIRRGVLDGAGLTAWLGQQGTRWVIDASHPYAELVSANLRDACRGLNIPLYRWQRPDLLDSIQHPLLQRVESLEDACSLVKDLGPRVLLTTGSKDLARWLAGLPGKYLMARVLPTTGVLAQCAALGLGVEQILALCPPFSEDFNRAIYQHCRPDVMITKASGREGGFLEKVRPCLALNIPCIVLTPPAPLVSGEHLLTTHPEFMHCLATLGLLRNSL